MNLRIADLPDVCAKLREKFPKNSIKFNQHGHIMIDVSENPLILNDIYLIRLVIGEESYELHFTGSNFGQFNIGKIIKDKILPIGLYNFKILTEVPHVMTNMVIETNRGYVSITPNHPYITNRWDNLINAVQSIVETPHDVTILNKKVYHCLPWVALETKSPILLINYKNYLAIKDLIKYFNLQKCWLMLDDEAQFVNPIINQLKNDLNMSIGIKVLQVEL